MPFLTARWENLILVNYAVEPRRLEEHLPPEYELDLLDGSAFVSLVAFDFLDTRVKGISWPGFRNFPEINLRFYVHHQGQLGVASSANSSRRESSPPSRASSTTSRIERLECAAARREERSALFQGAQLGLWNEP